MELQFDKTIYKSLHKVVSQVLDQELTQEIRLPDSMPDIGRVLGSWGQIVLRSKEWFGNSIGISGGVMAWILYVPENGIQAMSFETWIPFQMKWDITETKRDGSICVLPLVKSLDSRTISARKFMLRANISVQCEAYEPTETTVYHNDQLPDDIQILKESYPLQIPVEAGEKSFQIDDELSLPTKLTDTEKLCYYDIRPQITETKILGDKLLFRGKANLHGTYFGESGIIQPLDQELTFSQYTQLDNEYGTNADALTCPVVTGIEIDITAERPMIKINLSAQYVIYDTKVLEITEDAYSISREVKPEIGTLCLLSKLDRIEKNVELSQKINTQTKEILDSVWYPTHAEKHQNGAVMEIVQSGVFQVLYLDMDGNMQGCSLPAKQTWELLSNPQNGVDVYSFSDPKPRVVGGGEEAAITVGMGIQAIVSSENGLQMVSTLEIGETKAADPTKPSFIVRKIGNNRIWDIAKQYGAKVSDIIPQNSIDDGTNDDRVILIPVC